MKILKIIGLLFATCFINNIQSMMPAQDEFVVERQFVQGDISSDEYLSYMTSLYPDYAYKIRDLRNVRGGNPYEDILIRINLIPGMAQQLLNTGQSERYNEMVQKVRTYVMNTIDIIYRNLKERTYRYGREH